MVRKIIILGCNGRMGRVERASARADPDVSVVAGFDVSLESRASRVRLPANFTGEADAVIDFSSPAALDGLLAFALERGAAGTGCQPAT